MRKVVTMDYIAIMRKIESTENEQVLKSVLNDIDNGQLPIQQYHVAKNFAQLRISYAALKLSGLSDSKELDLLASALDKFRLYEHEL